MIFSVLLLDLSHFTPDAIPTKWKMNNRVRIFLFFIINFEDRRVAFEQALWIEYLIIKEVAVAFVM